MANLKDIRDRIVSVKNTRKITEAMRLVAAAKVRRAQDQVLRSRPFADRLARVLENIQSRMQFEASDSPLLNRREVKTITLLAVTGDRGLCGGFNTNIIKKAKSYFQKILNEGKTLKIITVGSKGYDQLKRTYKENIIEKISFKESKHANYFDADKVGKIIIDKFEKKEFDVCAIFYNQFKNVITQIPQEQQIIPLKANEPEGN